MADIHVDPEQTRALQESAEAIATNLATMRAWGAYNLLRVDSLCGAVQPKKTVVGYVTCLAAISGSTPKEMVSILGLRKDVDLVNGAVIYQLDRVPEEGEFLPRGYTTLPNGLRLKPGVKTDADGYGPGHGAWQVQLVEPGIPASLFAVVHPGNAFEPPLHPRVAALYGR